MESLVKIGKLPNDNILIMLDILLNELISCLSRVLLHSIETNYSLSFSVV